MEWRCQAESGRGNDGVLPKEEGGVARSEEGKRRLIEPEDKQLFLP